VNDSTASTTVEYQHPNTPRLRSRWRFSHGWNSSGRGFVNSQQRLRLRSADDGVPAARISPQATSHSARHSRWRHSDGRAGFGRRLRGFRGAAHYRTTGAVRRQVPGDQRDSHQLDFGSVTTGQRRTDPDVRNNGSATLTVNSSQLQSAIRSGEPLDTVNVARDRSSPRRFVSRQCGGAADSVR